MISTAEVARLAHRLGVGDRVIEKDYVLSWLLVAIAESDLRSKLAFKGGTALKRCYYPDYRFSEDLDFTLHVDLPHDDLIGTRPASTGLWSTKPRPSKGCGNLVWPCRCRTCPTRTVSCEQCGGICEDWV